MVYGQLLESEIVVDLRQIGSARGAVRVEKFAATVDGTVIVELDGLFHAQHRVDRPVHALQADRVVEIWGGIERIELLGDVELLGIERIALLLEIGLAEIRAEQRVAGIEANSHFQIAPALCQRAVADDGKPEAEARERIRRVEFDGALEGFTRDPGAELDQCGKAENEVHPFEVWRELNSFFGRFARPLAIAEHEPQLAESGPGKRIFAAASLSPPIAYRARPSGRNSPAVHRRELFWALPRRAQARTPRWASASAAAFSFCTTSMTARNA